MHDEVSAWEASSFTGDEALILFGIQCFSVYTETLQPHFDDICAIEYHS